MLRNVERQEIFSDFMAFEPLTFDVFEETV